MDYSELFLLRRLRSHNFSALAIDTIESVFRKRGEGKMLTRAELELLDTVVISLERIECDRVTA
ncbi:hypothetical protein Pse7367_0301 [Thalassoporum mexicanum PCC 7367]|uniref:hypothetical protein n=1 Tax=Thalassoporum mexicanum TaxID=3457544 RepID=UPI00029FA8EF|nr:hypothetical protein [Pseudanabaena sp. PCC 7367]AFY68615.1 hypothetical protein Pse7367_0301 [Pseudanabaena sp. PCC 7367]